MLSNILDINLKPSLNSNCNVVVFKNQINIFFQIQKFSKKTKLLRKYKVQSFTHQLSHSSFFQTKKIQELYPSVCYTYRYMRSTYSVADLSAKHRMSLSECSNTFLIPYHTFSTLKTLRKKNFENLVGKGEIVGRHLF